MFHVKHNVPTRSGYHFVGWYTDSKYKNQISVIEKGSEGSLTLYAKWTKEISPVCQLHHFRYMEEIFPVLYPGTSDFQFPT